MNIFTALSFLSFLMFTQAGIFAIWKGLKTSESRLFTLLSFLFAIYAGVYSMFFKAESVEKANLFDILASPGWVFFPMVTVYLFIAITRIKNQVITWINYLFLIPASVYSFYIAITDLPSVKLFYRHNNNWYYSPIDTSTPYYIFILYLIVCVLISYFLLISWYFMAPESRDKFRARILLIWLSVFFIVTFFTNLVLPYVGANLIPAVAPINALALISGFAYVLYFVPRKTISSDMIYNLIVNHIKEFLFIADSEGKIYTTNHYTLANLRYNNYEIARSEYSDLFSEPEKVEEAIRSTETRSVSRQIRIDLIASNKDPIPVMLYVIKVTDSYKRNFGYVLSCIDYRQKLQLRDEVAERVRTEKNLSQIRRELEILVKKRTQELQEANLRLQQEVMERRSAEEQIKADLYEKVKLVQEIHHRVKNNIQVIISLVNMLCSHPKIDIPASEKLREIAEKVRYISKIHEDFYSSPNLSSIAFAKYLKKAVGELYSNYGRRKEIVFKLNIADENLDINEAIPLGIIFNELLINAISYAFEADDEKKQKSIINIEYFRNNGRYSLIVSDNGVGLPGHFNEIKSNKVGLQLVSVLVKDHLNGRITHVNQDGATFVVTFESIT